MATVTLGDSELSSHYSDEQALRQLSTDLTAALNTRDPGRVASLCAPDYWGVNVGEAAPQHGPDGMRESVSRYLRAFPDLQFTLDEVVIQGNRVVQIWTARGTHQGPLMNIPATDRTVEVRGVSVYTIEDGKVSRGLFIWDVAGLLRNMGLLPEL